MKRNDKRNVKDIFTHNGYKKILKSPTRITRTSATLIDVILTNNQQNISHVETIPSALCDHDLTACIRKMNNIKYNPVTIRCRDYRNYNVNEINKTLSLNKNWVNLFATTSPSVAWKAMSKILKDTLDSFAPFITKRVKTSLRHGLMQTSKEK